MKKILLMSTFIGLLSSSAFGMYESEGNRNPFQNLDYREVSNLRKIQIKYQPLMKEQGCAKNLDLEDNNDHSQKTHLRIEDYQSECLKHLQHVRNATIFRPAFQRLWSEGILFGFALIGSYIDPDSIGSSFMFHASIAGFGYTMNGAISSIGSYLKPPTHPVDDLEQQYVKEQCFIPKNLWPGIIEKLMIARQNPFEQREALNYLSFTLGLTLYKAERPIEDNIFKEEAISRILSRVDYFFMSYEPLKNPLDKATLRTNIKCFLQNLLGNTKEKPMPLFVHGVGGIGKTFFASQLIQWINEELPNSISEEAINITSPDELEGSESRPGAFLKVLRNKCLQRTRGSVVIMDEANWLNQSEFEAPAKRVFNGDLSKLSTDYFGKGIDGERIQLPMPPMLVFAAANQAIEEDNLRSRFAHFEFPRPKKEALREYALKIFQEQIKEREIGDSTKEDVLSVIQGKSDFREIKKFVPAYLNSSEEEKGEYKKYIRKTSSIINKKESSDKK